MEPRSWGTVTGAGSWAGEGDEGTALTQSHILILNSSSSEKSCRTPSPCSSLAKNLSWCLHPITWHVWGSHSRRPLLGHHYGGSWCSSLLEDDQPLPMWHPCARRRPDIWEQNKPVLNPPQSRAQWDRHTHTCAHPPPPHTPLPHRHKACTP